MFPAAQADADPRVCLEEKVNVPVVFLSWITVSVTEASTGPEPGQGGGSGPLLRGLLSGPDSYV